MPNTYTGNKSTTYPNYLIYGNNGCLEFDPSPTSKLSDDNSSTLPKSPIWNFKSCDSNNPHQQFTVSKVSTLTQYNAPITNKSNSSYIINDASNAKLGFYTVNPINSFDQCLQLNNDGISVMPCNMDSSQRFKPSFQSVIE